MNPSKVREVKLALISDPDWVERFNGYSESGFLKRYQQYFNTSLGLPRKPVYKIEIKDWHEDTKKN